MSWEDNIYMPEHPEKYTKNAKEMDPMLALRLTSKKMDKPDVPGKISLSNLPPEILTKIYEHFESKVPVDIRGRRPPGTVYREPENFLRQRRLKQEIPQEVTRRMINQSMRNYEKRLAEQVAIAKAESNRAEEILRLWRDEQDALREVKKRYPQTVQKGRVEEFINIRRQSRRRRGLDNQGNFKEPSIRRKLVETRANTTISKKTQNKARNF